MQVAVTECVSELFIPGNKAKLVLGNTTAADDPVPEQRPIDIPTPSRVQHLFTRAHRNISHALYKWNKI